MKKILTLAVLGLSASLAFTSCKKDEPKPDTPQEKVEFKVDLENPTNKDELTAIKASFDKLAKGDFSAKGLNASAKADLEKWWAENEKVKALENQASKGQAGFLDTKKKRHLTANGVEPIQLIYKGLIGAYQLNVFNGSVLRAMSAKTTKEKTEAINVAVVALLGDLRFDKTSDEFKKENNSFGKYLMAISTKKGGKYEGIAKKLEDAFKRAYKHVGDEKNTEMVKALATAGHLANTVTAFRGVHYISGYVGKLREPNGVTGNNVHEISEGLGFIYSLQFAYKYNSRQHGQFHLSKKEAQEVVNVSLWEEAENQSGNSLLDSTAEKVAKDFGFTLAEANA